MLLSLHYHCVSVNVVTTPDVGSVGQKGRRRRRLLESPSLLQGKQSNQESSFQPLGSDGCLVGQQYQDQASSLRCWCRLSLTSVCGQ